MDEESQKGPLGSGRVMASILSSESWSQEKRYLHDYSYTLFERHLKNQSRVSELSEANIVDTIQGIDQVSFVEVRAKVIFNDMKAIKGTMESFNELGEALAYVTTSVS